MKQLDSIESAKLKRLESNIVQGANTVGEALTEIRDLRLYRATHATFEDYCLEKWGINLRKANRLIESSDVRKSLEISQNLGQICPISESGAKELAPVQPEKRAEVLAEAVKQSGGKKPTAKTIRAVVDAVIPRSKPTAPEAPTADVLQERVTAMEDENAELKRILDSVTADDKAKELLDVNEKFEASLGRIRQLHETHNEAVKSAKYYQSICDRLRKLLNVEKASQIVAAVEKLVAP